MPQGDQTGPAGAGPMTGRGAGRCTGSNVPGWRNGCGRGLQRGYRRGAHAQNKPAGLQEEMEALRMQLAAFGQQLAEK